MRGMCLGTSASRRALLRRMALMKRHVLFSYYYYSSHVYPATKLTDILGCARRGSGPTAASDSEVTLSPPHTPVMQSECSAPCRTQI